MSQQENSPQTEQIPCGKPQSDCFAPQEDQGDVDDFIFLNEPIKRHSER